MGFYTNTYCPKCKYSFSQGFQRTGIGNRLGLPEMKCPNCGVVVKTGNNIFSKMSQAEKQDYYLKNILQILVNAFAICIFLIGIFDYYEKDYENNLHIIILMGLLISSVIIYLYEAYRIDKYEKAYKSKDYRFFANTKVEKKRRFEETKKNEYRFFVLIGTKKILKFKLTKKDGNLILQNIDDNNYIKNLNRIYEIESLSPLELPEKAVRKMDMDLINKIKKTLNKNKHQKI